MLIGLKILLTNTGALWERVMDDGARTRFIDTVSTHMSTCTEKEIIKRQIAIFRHVHPDIATGLEKKMNIKGYESIVDMKFNGTHNGMSEKKSGKIRANDMPMVDDVVFDNGAPQAAKL